MLPWIKGTAVGGATVDWNGKVEMSHSTSSWKSSIVQVVWYISTLLGHREQATNKKMLIQIHCLRFKTSLANFLLLLKFAAGKVLCVRRSMGQRAVSYFPVMKILKNTPQSNFIFFQRSRGRQPATWFADPYCVPKFICKHFINISAELEDIKNTE